MPTIAKQEKQETNLSIRKNLGQHDAKGPDVAGHGEDAVNDGLGRHPAQWQWARLDAVVRILHNITRHAWWEVDCERDGS